MAEIMEPHTACLGESLKPSIRPSVEGHGNGE